MMCAIVVMLAACTEDVMNIFGSGHEIAFEVKMDSVGVTRSSDCVSEIDPQLCITADGDTFYLHTDITPMPDVIQSTKSPTRGATADATSLQGGFGVSAYNTDGTTQGDAYFLNSGTSFTTVSSVDYYTLSGAGTKKYWPVGKLNFFAYYPYVSSVGAAADAHGLSLQSNAYRITYTIPSTPADHPDLMTAKLTSQHYVANETEGGVRALSFNHALCAIRFQTGTDIAGGVINSISFNGIYGSGTYDISAQDWITKTPSSGAVSFTGLSKGTTEGTAGTAILTGDNTLMLIPQDFTSDPDASITINFTPTGSTARDLTCSLTGTKWEAGKCITYTITTDGLVWDYVLTATGGSTTYAGGNVSYSVTSYRYKRTTPSVKEAIAWQIDGYKADGASDFSSTAPTWLTVGSGQNAGTGMADATAENKNLTVGAQSSTSASSMFTDVVKGTSSSPYDLSTNGGTTSRNTANCYIVDGPGWYMIPLVYGNGIKNGSNNTSAYSTNTFIDYKGNKIKSLGGPYVNQSGTAPSNAVIVWQDANNLLDNVSYVNTSPGYIKFHVGTNMVEGNSLIAIRDGSNIIMWSWHIWVSATDINNVIPTKTSDDARTYHMMPVLLGWVNIGNTTIYPKRKCEVKLKQIGSNMTTTLLIYQNPYIEKPAYSGYATYYQWGRKDPQIPIDKTSGTLANKTIYNGLISSFYATQGPTSLKNSIRTPHYYYYDIYYQWQDDNTLYDLWNVGNTSYSGRVDEAPHQNVVKSVYDPCPVGFKIPPATAFTGITTADENNEWGVFTYTRYSPSQKVFFPILGHRDYQSSDITGSQTETWSSLPIYKPVSEGGRGAIGALSPLYMNFSTISNSYGAAANNWGFNVISVLESDE